MIIDPDEQAQHVVRLIFDMFTRLGTLNAVLRDLAEHDDRFGVEQVRTILHRRGMHTRERSGPDNPAAALEPHEWPVTA